MCEMIMKLIRLAPLFVLSLALLLSACGPSNTVRLLPLPQPGVSVLPAPNAPRISVVPFEDKRMDANLGTRRDGSAFVATEDVAQWVSRGLADELTRAGLQVSYALTPGQARSGNPDYIITGKLEEVWIKEVSSTELTTGMRATYVLASRSGKVSSETLTSGQSRNGLPGGSVADDLMRQTMLDLVQPMAAKIKQTVSH